MTARILQRCPCCLGGKVTVRTPLEIHRYMGGSAFHEYEDDCLECKGTGLLPDSEWEEYEPLLDGRTLTCSCGWTGTAEEFQWFEAANGFMAQCGACGSSLLVAMSELEGKAEAA